MDNSSNKFSALLLLLTPIMVQAAPPAPSIGEAWPDTEKLTVSVSHELNWPAYTGFGFSPFGYDAYYDSSDQDPGYNPTRIETNAQIPWTDSLPGYEERCIASDYWIRAYDKGRKTYSPILRAETGYVCGSTPPVADAGPDQTVGIDEQVTLDGSGSNDIDGNIVSYKWSIAGATIPDGETTSVSFLSVNTYTITLTVTDDNDETDTDMLDVTVSDTPPPPPPVLFSDLQGDTPSCGQTKLSRNSDDIADPKSHAPLNYPNLVFNDEFDSLESDVWNSRYEWSSIINNEAQYYVDALGGDFQSGWSPFSIADSKLTITAKTTSSVDLPDNLTEQLYVSGVLNTQHKVSFNGAVGGGLFFEAYARPARGNGMWSAFWLYHQTYNNPDPEIDIFEYLGQSKNGNAWIKATNKDGVEETANYNTWDTQYHTYFPGAGGPKGKQVSNGVCQTSCRVNIS